MKENSLAITSEYYPGNIRNLVAGLWVLFSTLRIQRILRRNMSSSSVTLWIFLLFNLQLFNTGRCQEGLPHILQPLVLRVERNWDVLSWAPVGSVVTYASVNNDDDHRAVFKLETLMREDRRLPFTIDNTTGFIYVNDTLQDWVGEELHLYVRVDDTESPVSVKSEVRVRILNDTSPVGGVGGVPRNPPGLLPPQYLPAPPKLHPAAGQDDATELTVVAFNHWSPTTTPNYRTTTTTTSTPYAASQSPLTTQLNETGFYTGDATPGEVNNASSATASSAMPSTDPRAAATAGASVTTEDSAGSVGPSSDTATTLLALTSALVLFVSTGAA